MTSTEVVEEYASTYPDNPELTTEIVGDTLYYSMDQIQVDGIQSNRFKYDGSVDTHGSLMFSLKHETDYDDRPADTGKKWNWSPNWTVSEKHWLSCRAVIPENSLCPECGKRD